MGGWVTPTNPQHANTTSACNRTAQRGLPSAHPDTGEIGTFLVMERHSQCATLLTLL